MWALVFLMILLEKGTLFNFSKVLQDGNESKFIQVQLYDDVNNLIGTYPVNHVGNGIYQNRTVPANTVGVFFAKYVVYKNASYTTVDKKYSQVLDMIRVEDIVEILTETIDFGDGSAS